MVIDLQGLLKSAFFVFLAKGKRKLGYHKTREFSYLFLNERIPPYDLNSHAVERYLNIAKYLGAKPGNPMFNIVIGKEDKENIQRFLTSEKVLEEDLIIIANPETRWSSKRWQNWKMAQLADKVIDELAARFIFTGGAKDSGSIREILSRMKKPAINASGKTNLRELAYLFKRAEAVITPDSGPMHIAAAVGTPVIALFGPTAPWRTKPYGREHVIIRKEFSCSPCYKKKCREPQCMYQISVNEVFSALNEKIKERRSYGYQSGTFRNFGLPQV